MHNYAISYSIDQNLSNIKGRFLNLHSPPQLMHVIHGGRCHHTNDHPFKIPTQLRLQVVNQILEDREKRKELGEDTSSENRKNSFTTFLHAPTLHG